MRAQFFGVFQQLQIVLEVFQETGRSLAFDVLLDGQAGNAFLFGLNSESDAFGFGDFLSEEIVEADGVGMGFSDALLHFIPLFGDKVDAQSKVLGFAVFDDSKEKRRFSFLLIFL